MRGDVLDPKEGAAEVDAPEAAAGEDTGAGAQEEGAKEGAEEGAGEGAGEGEGQE